MVSGLFNKKRLIDVIHNFIFFPDNSTKCTKLVCRCQQYYAAKRLLANIKKEIKPDGNGKGGTYFGATGSGKSLTMLYLTRLLMRDKSLSSPTIVLISDRNDLDKQIAGLFTSAKTFINDDDISRIENRSLLKSTLKNRTSGGVYMTTIQKFSEGLDLLSDRANIICLSDEAHRTQTNLAATYRTSENEVQKTYGFAKYLHDSFPNATYVGFSGTPIDATIETFGKVVDSYTMSDSVRDGVTVNITYEGRANKVLLDDNKLIEIEKYYEQAEKVGASEYQIEESKKAVGKLESIIGNDSRLTTLARDIITHYETRVSEGATVSGKAMIVCMTRKIAYELYKKILKEKPE
jgi:type I restriction enzyme R subunit